MYKIIFWDECTHRHTLLASITLHCLLCKGKMSPSFLVPKRSTDSSDSSFSSTLGRKKSRMIYEGCLLGQRFMAGEETTRRREHSSTDHFLIQEQEDEERKHTISLSLKLKTIIQISQGFIIIPPLYISEYKIRI
jgi:hypothetical protein